MLDYLAMQFPATFPVLCSEIVNFVSEYRVYVVQGVVRGICRYKGPDTPPLDNEIVEAAVRTLFESEEGKDLKGCGLDFAVMKKKGQDE